MGDMLNVRVALTLVCAGALSLAACGNDSAASSTTTSASPVAADATTSERFEATVAAGGGIFYSFNIAAYGNVAVTVLETTGTGLPDDFAIGVGIGRPSGTSCATTTAISAVPGDAAQLTGTFGPGIFCVRIYDVGTLTGPVRVAAVVAHS